MGCKYLNKNMCRKKMRIGILCGPKLADNEKRVLKNLGLLLHNEIELDIIGVAKEDSLKEHFNLYSYKSWLFSDRYTSLFYNCIRYTIDRRPSVLYHLICKDIRVFVVAVVGYLFRIPTVTMNSGERLKYYKFVDGIHRKIKAIIENQVFSRVGYKISNKVAALGEDGKNQFLKMGVASKKIVVLPQAINFNSFNENYVKSDIKKICGFPVNKKVILFVGRLTRAKGLNKLVKIILQTLDKRNDILFCIIGDGPYREILNGLRNDNILLIGKIDFREISMFYKASDLLILPSLSEGLPNVILEAMACGLPVVASNVGEIPSLISHSYKKTDEFVEYILKSDWKSDPIPIEFSWEIMRDRYISLFESIIMEWNNAKR